MAYVLERNNGSGSSLLNTDEDKMADLTIEEVMKKASRGAGVESLIDLRVGGAARAATMGRLDLLQHFIEKENVPVNTITPAERNLIEAMPDADEELKRIMLFTPLICALEQCNDKERRDEMISYLLDRLKKEELETRDLVGKNCLILAASAGKLKAVKRLVAMGADIDSCCNRGHRAICYALQKRHGKIVIFLLEQIRAKGLQRGARPFSMGVASVKIIRFARTLCSLLLSTLTCSQ